MKILPFSAFSSLFHEACWVIGYVNNECEWQPSRQFKEKFLPFLPAGQDWQIQTGNYLTLYLELLTWYDEICFEPRWQDGKPTLLEWEEFST